MEPLRYGILPNAAEYAPIAQLERTGLSVEIVNDTSRYEDYDALIGYGLYDGWEPVQAHTQPVVMALDVSLAPLNQPDIAQVVRNAVNGISVAGQLNISGVYPLHTPSTSLVDASQLANIGYAEGVILYGVWDDLPGVAIVREQLARGGVTLVRLSGDNAAERAHMRIERGDDTATDALPLYTLPLSYRARDNLAVSFTDTGWLIISR